MPSRTGSASIQSISLWDGQTVTGRHNLVLAAASGFAGDQNALTGDAETGIAPIFDADPLVAYPLETDTPSFPF